MQSRRSLRLVAGALVLALPLLGSCGFDKATNRPYTPAAGTIDREGDVKILSAVVVAAQPDSGTFIATLSNSRGTNADADTFEDLSGSGEWSDLAVTDLEPLEIASGGFVNLAEEGGVAISGDFEAGDFMDLTLSFASGQTTTMQVPVVFACGEYADLDTSAGSATSTATEEPSESTDASETEVDQESVSGGEAYDCGSVSEEE